MSDAKYAMTGATGHIGYPLAQLLEQSGEGYRLLLRRDPDYLKVFTGERVRGDLTNYESLLECFDGVDTVFHLAGCISLGNIPYETVYNVNVTGTRNVINACIAKGVRRLVYMGTVDTYEETPGEDKGPISEQSIFYPEKLEGDYARTKAEATNLVLAANGRQGLETIVLQPSACVGPYDYNVSSVGVMVRMFVGGKFPLTMSFGAYDFVDVRDIAAAALAASTKGEPGSAYILSGYPTTIDEFVGMLCAITGKKKPSFVMSKRMGYLVAPLAAKWYKMRGETPLFTPYTVRKLCSEQRFTHAKATRDLGYDPMRPERSLKDMVDWLGTFETPQK